MADLVAAVDAGNSKIDALLVDTAGRVRARSRGGPFQPQLTGVPAAIAELAAVMSRLLYGVSEPVRLVSAYLAGADSPEEESLLHKEVQSRHWGQQVQVGNDTLALLRCGAPEGWGVAVVCGAGINAVGVDPDGNVERFPALGPLTGDWGGGASLGHDALYFAVRAEDGRGAATVLSADVAEYFGLASSTAVGVAMSRGEIDPHRLVELTRLLFAAAARADPVALELVGRMAHEVATMARTLITRMGLADAPVPVVLGGGVLSARFAPLLDGVEKELAASAPGARCVVADVAPVVGAALLGLDTLGVPPEVGAALVAAERR
jgi:N-acetylglucosamine kinase-like BadF-type ATPase